VVNFLLAVTFACGVVIAVAHVLNRRFIAPAYDVVANLTAFACAVAASLLLGHLAPALLSAGALLCWLVLARRTSLAHRRRVAPVPPEAERGQDRREPSMRPRSEAL
jgi:hypothetical protein